MTSLDWSGRYLTIAIVSTSGTVIAWFLESAHIPSIALLTAVGFATLALFHARHLQRFSLQ